MPKINTSELTGAALDWAVAKCDSDAWEAYDAALYADKPTGPRPSEYLRDHEFSPEAFSPSTNWSQGGPIIERECFSVEPFKGRSGNWGCFDFKIGNVYHGPTPLIAAMRCYVASKLGDVVDVPEELAL